MKVNLYWCTTQCNSENWFVFAKTEKQASEWFEEAEGFDEGYSHAEHICKILTFPDKPEERGRSEFPDWAQIDDLKKIGFIILNEEIPREVEYKGQVFKEGGLTYQVQKISDLINNQKPDLN